MHTSWKILLIVLVSLFARDVLAQTAGDRKGSKAPTTSYDCTEVKIDYVDDPSLTREEKITLMDQALLRSLSKFEACQNSQAKTANSGGSSGASSTNGSQDAGGGGSVAASDVSGTEQRSSETTTASKSTQPSDRAQANAQGASLPETSLAEKGGGKASGGTGRLPADIPPANNDSVLEAQIRQAAITEKDPEIQARLWNEYRKYKKLPLVK